MRRRSRVIIPVLVVLAALILSTAALWRNTQRPGYGINQQSRNFIGQNMVGATPSPGLYRGYTSDDLGATPGTGLNGVRQQMMQQTVFDRQKADNIRSRLSNIKGIRQINAVVSGNTALIGYSRADGITKANSARNIITDSVKKLDNTITNVIVSDSADFSSRIKRLTDNINKNKPINGLTDEFNRLIQKMKTGSL